METNNRKTQCLNPPPSSWEVYWQWQSYGCLHDDLAPRPPGPGFAIPFLGHLHLVDKDPRGQFAAWRRRYGDIFSLYIGGRPLVVLNGYDVIKEAMVRHADAFSNRPNVFYSDSIRKKQGVSSTSGELWKEQRKVSLEILKEMGLGKNILSEKVQEEVNDYVKAVASHKGQAVHLQELTSISVSNVICSIIFGEKFQYDDQSFLRYLAGMDDVKVIGAFSTPFQVCSTYLVTLSMPNVSLLTSITWIHVPQIEKHKHTYKEGETNDFIDGYIREIMKCNSAGRPTTLNESNLQKVLGDLLIAGTETTSTIISWALLLFLHYPEVQEKCFQEVSLVIGTQRAPNMQDKQKMTYVEATIMEVQRWANVLPFGVWRGLACDINFRGYHLPKDAIVIPNLDSVFKDPEIWPDPHSFKPERFILAVGKLNRPEELIPFGIGRRVCLGESLARLELFLYLATLIQQFRFLPVESEPLPSLEGMMGITFSPKPYKICACPRNNQD